MTNTYYVKGRLEKYTPIGDVDNFDYRQISTHVEATSPEIAIDSFLVDGWHWCGAPVARLMTEAMKIEDAAQPSLFPLPDKL